jgi:hypothetical protein
MPGRFSNVHNPAVKVPDRDVELGLPYRTGDIGIGERTADVGPIGAGLDSPVDPEIG